VTQKREGGRGCRGENEAKGWIREVTMLSTEYNNKFLLGGGNQRKKGKGKH